jgi:hypothetical protein
VAVVVVVVVVIGECPKPNSSVALIAVIFKRSVVGLLAPRQRIHVSLFLRKPRVQLAIPMVILGAATQSLGKSVPVVGILIAALLLLVPKLVQIILGIMVVIS